MANWYNKGMEDAKEEIRARLPVEDVVGQYIELKRAGRNLKGHSPWGTDRTPSFMVSPEKGIWHDFSSNKGGDIFSFVMEMEGLSFREALEKLAEQAGVELRKYSGNEKKFAEKKRRMYELLELACKYYQVCLTRNKAVCQYVFYERNLNKGTVEKFRIGYAPKEGRALVKFLKRRGFREEELEEAGLVNRFGGDFFKGRMMVPLMDASGRVLGFTGRIVEKDENSPKYVNTKETILYDKGRHIFGLSQAREAIRRSDFVVVVEGNMDVISSHQAGVCEAVATAGTAMTEAHLKSFARMTKDIRLAYDGDNAGVAAAERAISMAAKLGIYLSVIDDYGGCKDADELIQKGAELWQKAVTQGRPAMEWILEKYEEKYDIRTEKGFSEYATEAKKLILLLEDAVLREKYERLVSEKLGISLEALRAKKIPETRRRLKKGAIGAVSGEKGGVVKNTTRGEGTEGSVVKNTTDGMSRAEKNLAALLLFGEVKNEGVAEFLKSKELSELEKKELELIFEEEYGDWEQEERGKEAKSLAGRVATERKEQRRAELEEAIRVAEEAGDEKRENELFEELNHLLRGKK